MYDNKMTIIRKILCILCRPVDIDNMSRNNHKSDYTLCVAATQMLDKKGIQ